MTYVKKIDMMHSMFGRIEGHSCKECSNLRGSPGDYYKCNVYGSSFSESTDWVQKWTACGLFNKDYDGIPIKEIVKRQGRRNMLDVQTEGQFSFFDAEQT